jgi:hypothetical protein
MAQDPPAVADSGTGLMRFFGHPVVGIIGSAATVLSLVLGIFFYFQGTRKRDLVYLVNPVQTVVVKTGEASQLHVSYGGQELRTDVTAAQIAVWNQGNESIRPENILEPVLIRITPAAPILEASIRKKSRGVVGVTLDQSRLSEGVVGVKWNILEQDDGAVIQLVYAGPAGSKIEASGVIEGQRLIRDRGRANHEKSLNEAGRKIGWVLVGLSALLLLLVAVIYMLRGRRPDSSSGPRLKVVDLASAAFGIALGFFAAYISSSPTPPFGF